MISRKIVLIGAGGFGNEVFAYIDRDKFEVMGFIDNKSINRVSMFGDDSLLPELKLHEIYNAAITIGNMDRRAKIFNECCSLDILLPNIIHKSANIFSTLDENMGIFVYPNAVLMSGCKIGKGTLINSGVTIGHDVTIGDFSNINPGVNLAGNITIGNHSMIGIGTSVREKIQIGDRVVIGAGSVVVSDIPDNSVAYGVPARIVKKNE